MDKTFEPQHIEDKWYKAWDTLGAFKANGSKQPYCITLPPPNVTGTLHMGHGFQVSLMDALIRYQRMQGKNTLWQAGMDHAGIATQMVVERQLAEEGIKRHDLGRDAFVDRVWQWQKQSGGNIRRQLARMGSSMDWERERFTLDDDICDAVRDAFIRMHEDGLIYRGKHLVNWDPALGTAISDLEVIQKEKKDPIWYIRYPAAEGQQHIVVATTRPETLFGDVAVAVHPDDERYQSLIGKELQLPLTNRTIPVIADSHVEQEFGTGCVKITPAHDFDDHAVGKRHNLPILNIFTPTIELNENAPEAYQGLSAADARKKVVEELTTLGLLEKTEELTHKVPHGDRSGAIIEPYLTDQWFIKAKPLAEPAIKAVKDGDITFIPNNWSNTYFQWMENIEDWCISRQLWWGHRIPAWYDADGNSYVGKDEADIRAKYKLDDTMTLTQDDDVLDTWFSSSLWPFTTLGWPEKTPELATFYPNSVLVTGFDIIFFWVARMVMMGLYFTGKIPFKQVYVTGLIRDHSGQKMSKSKGNVLDPIDLIDGIDLASLVEKRTSNLMQPEMAKKIRKITEKEFPEGIPAFGTDALRFTFCALASTGRDINFDMGRISGYRNFCNKLWNASRFVMMNCPEKISNDNPQYSMADRWILSRLQQTIQEATKALENYRFDLLAKCLYEFTWNDYCDWYVEFSKPVLYAKPVNKTALAATQHTLLTVLEALLRLLHPITPFITEEIWQRTAPLLNIDDDSIILQPYPTFNEAQLDKSAIDEFEWLKGFISAVRNIRGEMGISPNKEINVLLHHGEQRDKSLSEKFAEALQALAKINTITWHNDKEKLPVSATALLGKLDILIPLEGLIDIDEERKRLEKQVVKMEKELAQSQKKLNNENYVKRAPSDVVAKEKEKVTDLESALKKLSNKVALLAN